MAEQGGGQKFWDFLQGLVPTGTQTGGFLEAAAPALGGIGQALIQQAGQETVGQFGNERQEIANQGLLDAARLNNEEQQKRQILDLLLKQFVAQQQAATQQNAQRIQAQGQQVDAQLQGSANQVQAGANFAQAAQAPLLRPITR